MSDEHRGNKVPAVTLAFWLAKIAATTLGETGGDSVSMTLNFGYLAATAIFAAVFVVALGLQVSARRYHPFNYWFVIVATTTVGTTISDYLDRTAGLGYPLTSLVLFASVLLVLGVWRLTTGTVSVTRIVDRKSEIFYWTAILASNTLGTALGDYLADSRGFGFEGGALVFSGLIGVVALIYLTTDISHTLLFWAAFILTRPLGATLGDILTKPLTHGGLDFDRIESSLTLAALMTICIVTTSLRKPAAPGSMAH
ncbi:MAG TPA: hypothetical protein VEJ86_06475 [Candidatus Binataceae bacterium]|nr:hypothetical protein [Candidatus Binataceae bacterium]